MTTRVMKKTRMFDCRRSSARLSVNVAGSSGTRRMESVRSRSSESSSSKGRTADNECTASVKPRRECERLLDREQQIIVVENDFPVRCVLDEELDVVIPALKFRVEVEPGAAF